MSIGARTYKLWIGDSPISVKMNRLERIFENVYIIFFENGKNRGQLVRAPKNKKALALDKVHLSVHVHHCCREG